VISVDSFLVGSLHAIIFKAKSEKLQTAKLANCQLQEYNYLFFNLLIKRIMDRRILLVIAALSLLPAISNAQNQVSPYNNSRRYLLNLNDAQLQIGLQTATVFALDDRASLSSNPHFQAMWNLIKLGATLETLLRGANEPLNDINLGQQFGRNGYNKTVLALFVRYGFGESSDLKLQRHWLELNLSSGYFREGKKGTHVHLDYQMNLAKTNYSAGGGSIARSFDYEIFAGARVGFDGSFARSESESGFFTHLNQEIQRIASENDFTAGQLVALQNLAESSRVLLPKDVGGRAFHFGPIAGARVSKNILRNTNAFASGLVFYDLMDLNSPKQGEENKRSQHIISLSLGLSLTIGGEGKAMGGSLQSFF